MRSPLAGLHDAASLDLSDTLVRDIAPLGWAERACNISI